MRLPTLAQLRLFCEHDHWAPKRLTDHWRYTKALPDGRHLRTKVSFGSGQLGDRGLFSAILREQLQVTEGEFWRVVDGDGPAVHLPPVSTAAAAASTLNLQTVLMLRKRGATEAQVRSLKNQDEAEALLRSLTR